MVSGTTTKCRAKRRRQGQAWFPGCHAGAGPELGDGGRHKDVPAGLLGVQSFMGKQGQKITTCQTF